MKQETRAAVYREHLASPISFTSPSWGFQTFWHPLVIGISAKRKVSKPPPPCQVVFSARIADSGNLVLLDTRALAPWRGSFLQSVIAQSLFGGHVCPLLMEMFSIEICQGADTAICDPKGTMLFF